jgi:predicted Fe-Mo cluster-binding NifX family protein
MKIAISAVDGSLDADVDPRFGRAAFFLVVDPDSLDSEAFPNPNVEAGGGAGIQSAQLVLTKGAQAVLTGSCGPNAFRALQGAGVPIFEGAQGPVRDMIMKWKNKELIPSEQPAGKPGGTKNKPRPSPASDLPSEKETVASKNQTNKGTSDRNEINMIKEDISDMEKRLDELNRRLDHMKNNA